MKIDERNTQALLEEYGIPFEPDESAHTPRFSLSLQNDTDHACLVATAHSLKRSRPQIVQERVNPILGIHSYQANNIAGWLEIPHEHWKAFREFCKRLNRAYIETDAIQLNLSSVTFTDEGIFKVITAQMSIDENALFRQPQIMQRLGENQQDETQTVALMHQLNYVRLNGQIGCMANGAGLAMSLIDDIITHGRDHGISAANFMDIGGGAKSERIKAGLNLLLDDPSVECVVVNIFGGITRCDEIAQIIVQYCRMRTLRKPMVLRLEGTNAARARDYLTLAHQTDLPYLYIAESLTSAVQQAINITLRSEPL